MEALNKKLKDELQANFNVKILDTLSWTLPVYPVEITFLTVRKTTMDILMKMMLMTFGKATIEMAEQLSELLLVEQLFIDDIMNKMLAANLIVKKRDHYSLTETGEKQLKAGIYEHEPVRQTKKLLYSPFHQSFMDGQMESIRQEEELFRYAEEFSDWDETTLENAVIINALENSGVSSNEGNVQVIISKIVSTLVLDIELVPCLEFRVYNSTEDLPYARVWNTLGGGWDEKLEERLNDKERKSWRAQYSLNNDT